MFQLDYDRYSDMISVEIPQNLHMINENNCIKSAQILTSGVSLLTVFNGNLPISESISPSNPPESVGFCPNLWKYLTKSVSCYDRYSYFVSPKSVLEGTDYY